VNTVQTGDYFVDRDQPPLTPEETEIVNRFHDLYYRRWITLGADTKNLSWFGHLAIKCPLDLWVYQELLVRTRPDVVVETGTWSGGSALYLAMIFDLIGHGRVITVDIEVKPDRPEHPRITYLTGSSVDSSIVAKIQGEVGGSRVLVILDSDHSAAHVYEELIAYNSLVQVGDYLIVEDTNVNGHPVWPNYGPGPMEAVDKFLSENNEFMIDERCGRFLMTINPRGYLKRIKPRRVDASP
jgi:cephalosporin hydroxylase